MKEAGKLSGIKVRAFPGTNPTKIKAMVETGLLTWRQVAERLSETPARIGRLSSGAVGATGYGWGYGVAYCWSV